MVFLARELLDLVIVPEAIGRLTGFGATLPALGFSSTFGAAEAGRSSLVLVTLAVMTAFSQPSLI